MIPVDLQLSDHDQGVIIKNIGPSTAYEVFFNGRVTPYGSSGRNVNEKQIDSGNEKVFILKDNEILENIFVIEYRSLSGKRYKDIWEAYGGPEAGILFRKPDPWKYFKAALKIVLNEAIRYLIR